MTLNESDIRTIKHLLEELRLYRNLDDSGREMAKDGLYDDEIQLAKKLNIKIQSL